MACWDVFGKFGLEDNFVGPFIYACLGLAEIKVERLHGELAETKVERIYVIDSCLILQ